MQQFLDTAFWTYGAPFLLVLVATGTSYAAVRMEKLLGLKIDSTHNQALTNAVTTFAGLVLDNIKAGKLTMADVRDGHVVPDLLAYLNSSVSSAVLHFNKSPADLNQMLIGKIGVSGPVAVPVTAADPDPGAQLAVALGAVVAAGSKGGGGTGGYAKPLP